MSKNKNTRKNIHLNNNKKNQSNKISRFKGHNYNQTEKETEEQIDETRDDVLEVFELELLETIEREIEVLEEEEIDEIIYKDIIDTDLDEENEKKEIDEIEDDIEINELIYKSEREKQSFLNNKASKPRTGKKQTAKNNQSKSKIEFKKLQDIIIGFAHKYKSYKWYAISIFMLSIILIVALIATSGEEKNPLVKAEPEIAALVENYFKAVSEGNMEKLRALVVDLDDDTEEQKMQEYKKYIEDYRNIECYTKKGIAENEYVVLVCLDFKMININTLAPSSVFLYVKSDKENAYKIAYGIKTSEISEYIEKISKDEDMIRKNQEVNDRLEKACEADEDLNEVYQKLSRLSDLDENTSSGDAKEEK